MVSSTALLVVLFAQLFALSAARDLWLQSLPRCWQSCFSNTGDGCSSSSCESLYPPRRHVAHCTDGSQASARRQQTATHTSAAPCLAPCRDAMRTTARCIWPSGPSSYYVPASVVAYPKIPWTTHTQQPLRQTTKTRPRHAHPHPQHAIKRRQRQATPRRNRPPQRQPRRGADRRPRPRPRPRPQHTHPHLLAQTLNLLSRA
jgi:hypothetical protein